MQIGAGLGTLDLVDIFQGDAHEGERSGAE